MLGKIGDIIFVIFIIAMLFPQGRMFIMSRMSHLLSMVSKPKVEATKIPLGAVDLEWELKTMDGKSLDFDNSTGQVKFINLWATWCPPCVGEMPEIQSLYKKFEGNENVKFYIVSFDDSSEKVKNFIDKNLYTFPIYMSLSELPPKLQTKGIPTTYILNKNNEIVVRKTGAANWSGDATVKILNDLISEN